MPSTWLRNNVSEKKRKLEVEHALECPVKRVKETKNADKNVEIRKALLSQDIVRASIFYGRPMHGISDVLNSMGDRPNVFILIGDIFPINFKRTQEKVQDIPKGKKDDRHKKQRMHWRLSKAKGILSRVIVHHNNCNYREILSKTCNRRVTNYVTAIVKKLFPMDIWGCESNQLQLLKMIGEFVRLRRFETYSLRHVLQNIKLSKIVWLSSSKAVHSNPSDNLKKEEIFFELIHWLFHSIVIPLLRTNFYVTESGTNKNKVFYFRHDDWVILTAPTVHKLGSSIFTPLTKITAKDIIANRKLAFSHLRLLPKERGARPITNLRRRISKEGGPTIHNRLVKRLINGKRNDFAVSINSMLQNSFQILTYEYKKDDFARGSSVLGISDIYSKLKSFKMRVNPSSDGFYFVKVDVVQCFDKINQDILLNVLKGVLLEEEYLIHKFSVSYPSAGRVVYSFEDKEDILQILEDHIVNNLVKVALYLAILGFPEHGCVVNSDKTLTNLPRDSSSPGIFTTDEELPWCGLLKKEILTVLDLNDSLTVKFSSHPWTDFRRKMMQYFKPKCHLILIDTHLNKERVVVRNVYENYMMCAMKFYLHLKELSTRFGCCSDSFAIDSIKDTIAYGYLLIRSKIRGKIGVSLHATFSLTFVTVEWLGLQAFAKVLERKRGSLNGICKFLEEKLRDAKYGLVRKRVGWVAAAPSDLWKVKL
ncbi:hypothetical protein HDU67_003321 [Dinochytrium kinnereticum]|nr:hypothetical protein HDU67_003321 [Dinochytrium kinnereticum]